ncbi:hypothetical protein Taro_011721 [Colocasia esculenta]|uniref:Uncharacterized protein n=1 Tax=Colocasia esculenta TaxID=4460 RepID=A0A843UDH7_COLES|nr:hypothetical protein [Colocasia esculenta]
MPRLLFPPFLILQVFHSEEFFLQVTFSSVPHLADLDGSDLFIKRHTRKDGKPTNEAAKHVIEKLKSLKSAQPLSDDSTPHQVAAENDTYTQVLGPDRPGRVSGVGTGPTPTSMWGNESKEALRSENRLLMQRMTELETSMAEKFAKMESMIRGSQVRPRLTHTLTRKGMTKSEARSEIPCKTMYQRQEQKLKKLETCRYLSTDE